MGTTRRVYHAVETDANDLGKAFAAIRASGASHAPFEATPVMIENLAIRFASMADIGRLDALINGAYRGESAKRGWTHEADLLAGYGNRIDPAELAETIADDAARILIAIDDATIVGCILVRDLGDRLGYFGLLAIAPELQASGLAKRLLAAAEDCARDTFGSTRVEGTVVHLRAELIAYYERRGFVRSGERRPFPIAVTPPLELVVLTKSLEASRGGAAANPT